MNEKRLVQVFIILIVSILVWSIAMVDIYSPYKAYDNYQRLIQDDRFKL